MRAKVFLLFWDLDGQTQTITFISVRAEQIKNPKQHNPKPHATQPPPPQKQKTQRWRWWEGGGVVGWCGRQQCNLPPLLAMSSTDH